MNRPSNRFDGPGRHLIVSERCLCEARATHERNSELHRISALRVGIAIAVFYVLLTAALVVTP